VFGYRDTLKRDTCIEQVVVLDSRGNWIHANAASSFGRPHKDMICPTTLLNKFREACGKERSEDGVYIREQACMKVIITPSLGSFCFG
jgi:hypothetical protein